MLFLFTYELHPVGGSGRKNKNMVKTKYRIVLVALFACFVLTLTSCKSMEALNTTKVHYLSIRKVYRYDNKSNPTIRVKTKVMYNGDLQIMVVNESDEIMTIDMEKSFVVTTSNLSYSFYDPTVRVESSSVVQAHTSSGSVNLGAVAGAAGVGGRVGQVLSGVNVGSSNTIGVQNATATYFSDQQKVSVAPHGSGIIPKTYNVGGIGYCNDYSKVREKHNSHEVARKKFSVCISYSVDGGTTWRKYVQWFFVNEELCEPVVRHGRVNDALRIILMEKTDCINEPWWGFYSVTNHFEKNESVYSTNIFEDYQ